MRKEATGSTATGGLQELTGRITVVVVLFVAAAVFFHLNGELLKDNRKMIKYIKSEEVFKRDLAALEAVEGIFSRYFVTIGGESNGEKSDPEKIKARYNDQLLQLVEQNDLQTEAYLSETSIGDSGFRVFKYDITLTGGFPDLLRLFRTMRESAAHMHISRCDVKHLTEGSVRIGLAVEIIGREG